MPADDFNERELIPGSLTGIRRFDVDSLGRLTGVTHKAVWRPGVNEAECRASFMSGAMRKAMQGMIVHSSTPYTYYTSNFMVDSPSPSNEPLQKDAQPAHRVGSKDCQCGFYAFFTPDHSGRNHGYGEGQITGIIEGTGVATVGNKGFRSEKGRIVALVLPELKQPQPAKTWGDMWLWERLRHRRECPGWAHYGSKVGRKYPASARKCSLHPSMDEKDSGGRALPVGLIRRNYPVVPVYPTLAGALREHPLSEPPAAPSPETCEDFWTRPAS